jgi:hypothetical protein
LTTFWSFCGPGRKRPSRGGAPRPLSTYPSDASHGLTAGGRSMSGVLLTCIQ